MFYFIKRKKIIHLEFIVSLILKTQNFTTMNGNVLTKNIKATKNHCCTRTFKNE